MLREEKPAVRVRVCGDLARFVDEEDLVALQPERVESHADDSAVVGDNVRSFSSVRNGEETYAA